MSAVVRKSHLDYLQGSNSFGQGVLFVFFTVDMDFRVLTVFCGQDQLGSMVCGETLEPVPLGVNVLGGTRDHIPQTNNSSSLSRHSVSVCQSDLTIGVQKCLTRLLVPY